jgi:sensor histidine kinase YesM
MLRFLYILLFLFTVNFTQGQQFNFANIGTSRGLPSSECYGLMQDSKGYMWVRTLNGLCKFDGKKFKIFTKKEGLKSNAIYAVFEDNKSRIWFATSTSHIGYIFNDSVFYLPSSELFAKENGYGQKVFYQIVLDENNNLFVSSHERAYKFSANDHYKTYQLYTQNDFYLKVVEINKQPFCIPDTVTKIRALEKLDFKLMIYGHSFDLKMNETNLKQGILRMTYPCKDKDGNSFFHLANRVYFKSKSGIFKEFNFENLVYHIFIDKENNLWIGFNSRGLLMFPNADLTKEPKHLLNQETISGITQDFEGGIWASSLNRGLFYCKNLFNENLISNEYFNYKPEMLKIIDSSLFISDFKSRVVKYEIISKKLLSKEMHVENAHVGILDIDKLSDGFLLSGRSSLYKVDNRFNFIERILWEKKLKLTSGAYNTIITSQNQIIGISKNYLTNYTLSYWYKLPSFGNDIIEFNKNVYIATKNGLFQFNNHLNDTLLTIINNENVIKLLQLNNKLLVICKDGRVTSIDNKHRQINYYFGNVSINDACIIDENKLSVASNTGIFFLDFGTGIINLFNTSDGILDNEIFKIASYKNQAFYSTINGIGLFNIDKLKNNPIAPKILLHSAYTNRNETFKIAGNYSYNSSFTFKFHLISFKDDIPSKLIYKLEGYNKDWNANESGEINYTNLTNGEYKLLVYVKNSSGVKSSLISIPFTVNKPFFKTSWFITLIVLLVFFISYIIYRITYYFINKREVNKTKVNKMFAEYQLMGLKAQMNPHFIFNCLNSIQKYVLEHDSKQAYTYMAKFSKLIRYVLDISDKTFIALSDELELVKIYAELEQLRFSKKFDFEINIDESIKIDDVMIPSMLIQPYLENAIWHGIMNLTETKKGEVKIRVNSINNHLEIVIEDNGVGRAKAKLLKQKTHQSKGLSINEKRIEAINYLLKFNDASVEIIDLLDQNNLAIGTKVVIKLPIKYDE